MVERTLISLPSQLQLIERLQHLIYLSSSLIFVSGESGSGKTTVTENLSNVLSSDLQQVYVSLATAPTAVKLRQQIISKLYDKALFNAEDSLLDSILRLRENQSKSRNRLIILDDAENLPADFIIELCELFSAPELTELNSLNILLLGDAKSTRSALEYIATHLSSGFQATLNHIEVMLPILTTEEANALLLHNFSQVGYKAKLEHQDALNRQLSLCHGNPKKIIKLADDLSQGLLEPDIFSWRKTPLPAVLLMLFLVAIVAGLAFYLYPQFISNPPEIVIIDESPIASMEEIKTVTVEVEKQEPLAGRWADLDLDISHNNIKVGLSDATEQRVVLAGNDLIELTMLVEQEVDSTATIIDNDKYQIPALLQTPEDTEQKTASDNIIIDNESSVVSDENQLIENEQSDVDSDETQTVDDASSTSVTAAVEKTVVSAPAAQPNIQEPSVAAMLPIKEVVAVKKSKPVATNKRVNGLFTDSSILLAKNRNYYTIQISGMASLDYLKLFQTQYNPNRNNVYAYQTIRNNKPWFVVIYGEYQTREAADSAQKNLPSVFKGMSTWVKTWQTVHQDLRLNNE